MRYPILCSLTRAALRSRSHWIIKGIIDLTIIVVAAAWAWYVSFSQIGHPASPIPFLVVILLARIPMYYAFGLHRIYWRIVSRYDVTRIAASTISGSLSCAIAFKLLPFPFDVDYLVRPYLLFITEAALYALLLCGARLAVRAIVSGQQENEASLRRIIIIGAGAAGLALAYQIQEGVAGYRIEGFVDDDPQKKNRRLRDIPVLGNTDDLPELADARDIDELVIAIPSLETARLRDIMNICEKTRLPVRILPPLRELIGGKADFYSLRKVKMEDLLPRSEVHLDREAITGYLQNRTVLVTGGGGSIGSELCRQVRASGASRLLILGHGENSVFEIHQELQEGGEGCEFIPIICDIQDRAALEKVFTEYRPEVVFHAAAHKHVPLMELYPAEAVKNNVLGTLNMADLASCCKVERFVLVSTDKAVRPSSVMGATKHLGEKIVKGYACARNANMVSVRFGNVLGSRGSVVRIMARQIEKRRPVTVTDPDMVRYFMTIPEAVQLILQAGAISGHGEVFVLDMGHPVRILDLAYDLIRLSGLVPEQDIPIHITGRRPGEKISEELFTTLENEQARKVGDFFVTEPDNVELESLLTVIGRLQAAACADDRDMIRSILKEVVPMSEPSAAARASVNISDINAPSAKAACGEKEISKT